jgi:hypothetical protein
MVVLLIGHSAAAIAGALLVLAAWASVIRTLIVPRRAGPVVRASPESLSGDPARPPPTRTAGQQPEGGAQGCCPGEAECAARNSGPGGAAADLPGPEPSFARPQRSRESRR